LLEADAGYGRMRSRIPDFRQDRQVRDGEEADDGGPALRFVRLRLFANGRGRRRGPSARPCTAGGWRGGLAIGRHPGVPRVWGADACSRGGALTQRRPGSRERRRRGLGRPRARLGRGLCDSGGCRTAVFLGGNP